MNDKGKIIFLGVPGMKSKDINNMEKYIRESYPNINYEFICENTISKNDLIRQGKDVDIVISWDQEMDDEIYEKLDLKAYCAASTGYNAANIEAATRNNVIVTNVSGYSSYEVATHTMMHILNLYRKTYLMLPYVKNGNWDLDVLGNIKRFENSTVGLFGFGKIPKEVAKRLKGFGVNIISSDPFVEKEEMEKYSVKKVDFETLLSESDYLSLHTPLNKATKHIINKDSLSKMKKTSYLINTARGGLVKSEDLYDALINKKIQGAGLDVLEKEPPGEIEKKIIDLDNTIVTAHSGYLSEESSDSQIKITAENVIDILNGNVPKNIVNREVLKNIDWIDNLKE